jgi:hypothetical protein
MSHLWAHLQLLVVHQQPHLVTRLLAGVRDAVFEIGSAACLVGINCGCHSAAKAGD